MHILELQNLVVERGGRRTVDGLSLAVDAGCVYALLGGNGAGKTTALDVLLGFVAPAAGRAAVCGLDPRADPEAARRQLAYLPENVALYPYLSGVENLRYFSAIGGVALDAARARQHLHAAGLAPEAHGRRAGDYSKGMRQKVGLAIAQARSARAMLLDEPTSGLDPAASDDLGRRLRAAAAGGMAVLMATHDLLNAKQAADRIGILQQGRLVFEADACDLSHDELAALYLDHARRAAEAAP